MMKLPGKKWSRSFSGKIISSEESFIIPTVGRNPAPVDMDHFIKPVFTSVFF